MNAFRLFGFDWFHDDICPQRQHPRREGEHLHFGTLKIYEKDGLHSINPEYSVIRVTDDDNVRLIGRVLGLVPEDAIASKEETTELLEIFESDSK